MPASCRPSTFAPLPKRQAVRVSVEDLNAHVIGACGQVLVDSRGDGFEVSPRDEAVDQAVAPAVRGVFPREAETVEVGCVAR